MLESSNRCDYIPSCIVARDITLLRLLKECTFSVPNDMLEVYCVNTHQKDIFNSLDEENHIQEWTPKSSDKGRHIASVMNKTIIKYIVRVWIARFQSVTDNYSMRRAQQLPCHVAAAIRSINNTYMSTSIDEIVNNINAVASVIIPSEDAIKHYSEQQNRNEVVSGDSIWQIRCLMYNLIERMTGSGCLYNCDVALINQYKEALCDAAMCCLFISDYERHMNAYRWENEIPIHRRIYDSFGKRMLEYAAGNGQLSPEASLCMESSGFQPYYLMSFYDKKTIDISTLAIRLQMYNFVVNDYTAKSKQAESRHDYARSL